MTISLALALLLVLSAWWPVSCAAALPPPRQQPRGQPVLKPVTKDPATLLYTIPIRDNADLVIDTAGPLVWSTCADDHLAASFKCKDAACKLANAYHAPTCRRKVIIRRCKEAKRCVAYPYNPVTGRCAAARLVHTRVVVNSTDGRNPVGQVSIRAVQACAPKTLLASLPAHAEGVAGLAGSGLALPAQIAASHNVPNKFMLCLPRHGGEGVAVFGGGPFFLPEARQTDVTSTMAFTPLVVTNKKDNNPMHYISVKAIAMDQTQVPLPNYALSSSSNANAVICTRVPYTLLRPDVYRPVVDAFAKALARNDARVVPGGVSSGFELCYRSNMLMGNTHAVPSVVLMLDGGKNWTMGGSNSMVDVGNKTACLAMVEMKGVKAGDANAPAMLIGGFQMENNLVQFDLEKKQLGFAKLPFFTSCSNFNFTRNQY
ncbi:hypothetical protein PR202_gb03813 [Eleusine coracana subsp. coracana]|uniref:Peptidase A1 domain-containing protein n=1 Tax=Eleusine coracana subsp. coracana TaxID=191504 RepID=A0AAV5E242_ELECO|nr:hypothetical protein QOZ80_1BG0095950 [Eleusine coracana subsp. coracana]GJN16792.1 hypothetical protein PR202_gb03813 [Eleusine coracana subsp. coracana]